MSDSNLSELLEQANILYRVSLDNYEVIRNAMLTDSNTITVQSVDLSGNPVELTLPSISYLTRRLDNLSHQFDEIVKFTTGESTYAELIDITGQLKALYTVSYDKLPPKITHNNDLVMIDDTLLNDDSDPLTEIFYPWVQTKIDLTSKVKINVNSLMVRRYKLTLETFAELNSQIDSESIVLSDMTVQSFQNWLDQNTNTSGYKHIEKRYPIEYSQVRYYGDFSVLSITDLASDTDVMQIKLSTIRYSDKLASQTFSRELVINDRLASKDGSTVYEIVSTDPATNTINLKQLVGNASIIPGVNVLTYLDQTQSKYLHLPVQFNERSIVFIASVDTWYNTVGDYSQPLVVDTSKINVVDSTNKKYTVDEFLKLQNAQDVGKFIKQLVIESNPAAIDATKPQAPALTPELFEVGVVNDHIINNADSKDVKKLVSNKKQAKIQLDKKQNSLFDIQNKINTGQYKNQQEKTSLEKQASVLANDVSAKLTQFKTIVQSLNESDAVKVASKNYKPKYRIQGFWPEPEGSETDSLSDNISHYIINYRYLAKTGEVSNAKSKTISQDGVEKTGVISPWKEIIGPKRKKIIKDGIAVWETNDISDSDKVNINQVEIPITPGEDVQIRIKSVSSVGQPFVDVESDWSNIVKVEFPESLESIQDLSTIQADLQKDLRKIELEQDLETKGLIRHVASAFYENNQYFAHPSIEIASGFYTSNKQSISLFDYLTTLTNDISVLQSAILNTADLIQVTLIDSVGNTYPLHRDGLTEIFGGYYLDEIGTSGHKGDIVTKNYYLKLTNLGSALTRIYSLLPGNPANRFTTSNADNTPYYNVPMGFLSDSEPNQVLPYGWRQYYNMIAYQRKRNFANNADLVVDAAWTYTPNMLLSNCNLTANSGGDYVVKNGSTYARVNGTGSGSHTDTFAVHKSHPAADLWINGGGSETELDALFDTFDDFKGLSDQNQSWSFKNPSATDNTLTAAKILFDTDDKYLLGQKSVGAYLTIVAQSKNLLQVEQADASYGKVLNPGESQAIVIPIVFQYRMADYTETAGGYDSNITDVKNYELSKTIGVDLLILGQVYKYDIKINAKYQPKSLSGSSIPGTSIGSISGGLSSI